ncbi:MAG: peptidylprolyl isomerase, partial [Hyphomicrobium sp.]|nr:peptidylprolyl isomerase [Hyphomicrobium sp.]
APVESRYGFHIVVVDRRIAGRELPFEMVQARIAAWLDEKVRRVAIRQYIGILAGRAEITGIALDANTTPLVQ